MDFPGRGAQDIRQNGGRESERNFPPYLIKLRSKRNLQAVREEQLPAAVSLIQFTSSDLRAIFRWELGDSA